MIPIRLIDTAIAFLGFILFIGTFQATLTTFDPNVGGAASEGNIRVQLTSGFIYGSIFALMLFRMEKIVPFLGSNFILILFLMVPLLSVAWSVSPDATIRRGIALLGSSFFAIYLAFALPPERTLRILTTAYAVTAAASIAMVVVMPNYGTHQFGEYAGLWRGMFANKNQLGAASAMGTILLILCPKYSLNERILGWLFLALGLLLLVMSESRTAWVAMAAVALIVVPVRWISGRGLKTKFQAMIFAVLTIATAAGIIQFSGQILTFMGKDATLTGRTGVWEVAVERAMERPMLGYGFRAYWTPENKRRLKPTEDWSDGIGHAHNTYIDLLVELGFLGVISFFFILCMLTLRIVRRLASKNDVLNLWAVACIVFILVRGFAESTILQHSDIHWIYFVYFFMLLTPSRSPRRQQQPFMAGHHNLHNVHRKDDVRRLKAKDLLDRPLGPTGADHSLAGLHEDDARHQWLDRNSER